MKNRSKQEVRWLFDYQNSFQSIFLDRLMNCCSSNKILAVWPHNNPHVSYIDKEDVPLISRTLQNYSFQRGME